MESQQHTESPTRQELSRLWDLNRSVPKTIHECMHTRISQIALQQPAEKLAVDAWDGRLTYRQLERLSDQLAAQLGGLGVGQDVVVPLCFEKSMYTVVAIMGVLKAGGAFVLLDVNQPKERLQGIMRQCRPKVICTSARSSHLCPSDTPTLLVQSKVEETPAAKSAPAAQGEICSSSWPMYICFTSGSTGNPKGVVVSHAAFSSARCHQNDAFRFHSEARVLDFASYAFDVAVYNVMMTLSIGATLCIPSEEQRKGALNETLRNMKVTTVALTPSTSRLLNLEDVANLETLILSGEAVTEQDLERLSKGSFNVLHAYGPAECTPMSTLNASPVAPAISTHMGTGIGAVTWITDPADQNKLMPPGMAGELLLEGPILANGYLGQPEETKASFIHDPPWLLNGFDNCPGRRGRLYKTGDIVSYDQTGNLEFKGRKDSQVKIRGQRFEFAEVEHHARLAMPLATGIVAEVIQLGGDENRDTLTVFVTGNGPWSNGTRISEGAELLTIAKEVDEKLSNALPAFMVPSLYIQLPDMPLSVTGKADRGYLRRMGYRLSPRRLAQLRRRCPGMTMMEPRNNTESLLRGAWAEVLGLDSDDLSTEEEFIALGGDSIAAIKLVGVARRVGISLTAADVFQYPTVTQQAQIQAEKSALREENMILPFELIKEDPGYLASLCTSGTAPIEDAYPCTQLQEGMFALSATRVGDYMMQATLKFSPCVDIATFKRAWEDVFRSTATLRTRIVQTQMSGLVQAVFREDIEWIYAHDLRTYLEHDRLAPMGLGDRLVRFALVGAQNGSPTHFVWTFHHALYDGWSLQLVSNLVNDVFRGIIEDAEELTGFSSFVRHVFQKDEEEMERYWKKYLDPDSELVTFPSLPMTIVRPVANASLTMELSPETRTGLTQSTMIRGALGILLGHHTASQDVVFGAISAGRNTPVIGIEDVRGPTIATVPVRVQIDPDQSIMKYLQGLQREATEMTPFEQVGLQRLAKMGPSARNACEFQTLLVVQPQEEELPSDDVLGHWTTSTTEQGFTTYAVTLECLTTSDGVLKVKASYDPRIMDEWKMTRMLHQLNLVLQQLATSPSSCKVADVQILTEEDTEIIRSWNNVEPKVDRRCIHDLIGEHTTATPDAPAIKSWDGQATYRELDQMSSHMATWLIEAGVGPEVVVPLCFEKSMYTVVSILAVFKAGGAFVLLDPGSPHSRLQKLCEQVYAKVAITSPACKSRLADFVPSILSVDDTFFARCGKLSPFMNPRAEPSNAAYIIFTSGSTGEPKGVIIEHQSYCSAVVSHREMNMSSSMRALQFGSYNFAGSIIEILMTLIHGGCICVPSEQGRGEDLANEIRRLNANWTFMTSTVLANLHPDEVPCLKTICVGGEPIRSVQIEQWASQVSLRQTYGSAELSGVVGSGRLDLNSQVTDVGKAVSAKIWLADARDINRLSPLGVPGEIIIEGPTVGREYIGQPEKTAAAFIKAPKWREAFGTVASTCRFYKTGDLAVYTSEGAVQLLGRKDTQVKLRGQRIEVGEVEQQARLATSEIQEVVVELTTFTGASRGPELVGFIVFRKQTNEKSIGRVLRLIQSRLEGALPHYMVPSLLVPIEELPLTASRKTDRRKLREMGALLSTARVEKLRKLMAGEKREPSTPVEQKLLRSWAEALGIPGQPGIGVDDSFFRLGGDSIAAIRLTVLARKSGILLSVADIFRNPTLVAQARVARQATGESIDNLVPFSLLVDDYGGTSAQLRSELALLCGINESVVLNAFPMTPIQEGLLSLTAKRDGDYVMQAILELPKNTNIEAFKRAWEAVVGASEALRARAAQHGQLGLVQVVCDDGIEWRQAANLERYLSLDKRDAMELGSSLSRYALIGQDEKHASHFVWTIHHALFDAWSITHILDSVHEAYQSGNAPRPTVPFANFVRYVSNVPSDESVSFWRTYLEGAELAPFPALPFWVQEPAADATLRVDLCANLKTEGVTSSILIRGALAMLINQYSGSPDVLIGSTVSGRNAPVIGVEEIVGPTIATVPVRIQVAEDQPVAAFLQSVQKDATDMIAYEQMGLQRIARMSEDGRKACGFQTLLVIHTSDDKLQQEDDARLGKWHAEEDHNRGFSTYGVILEVYLKNSGPTTIKATYDTRVISTWKMNKLLQNLDTLLKRLEQPASASQTVKQVCAISEQDTLTITTWNKGMPDVNNSLVHATIHQRAVDRPDSPAVQSWDGSLTYTELDLLSNKLASILSNLGVGPEIIVPILSEKSMWSIVSILGILKAGGAFVLLDPGQPRARLEKLCRQVRASTAVTSIPSKDGLFGIVSTSVAVGWELLDSLCESKAPVSTVRPDNVAYVIFTSGSTGEPKGVVVEHRSYVSGALNQGPLMGMSVKTRALQFGSYNFAGCIMEMLITMLNGGCVCIPSEEQRGTQLQQTIRDLDANWTFLTSTVLENMTPDEVPCIRTICVGGEPARAAQIKQWSAACHLRQTYGAAETGTVVSSAPLNTSSTTGDVGKATAGKYWIVNPTDSDMLMPVGAPGEVLIEGPTIAREYLDRPEKSATAFIKPPAWRHSFEPIHEASRFYMTGDLAAYKDDGSIQLMGRKDTQIKLRGQRIEAGEVEHHAVLASAAIKHAVVDLCLVSGGFEGRTKPQLVGFLVVETPAGQRADYSDLKHGAFDTEVQRVLQKVVARLENALPHYMVPSVLVPIPQLPLTTTGKTDRRRLREMGSSLSEQEIVSLKNAMRSARRAPLKDRERRMQTIWASVLNLDLDQISMDDSFFRLGGDSIGAMKLVGMAHTMGMNLSVADVFRNPILAAQALIIDENKDETEIERVESFSMLNMAPEKARNELGSLCCVDPDQVEDAYPCTPLQEGLMYHTGQRAGDYTMQAVMQISHLVSLVSFKTAWKQVFAASPILRTRIVHHNSSSALIQVVCREHEPWIQVSGDLEDYMAKDQVVSMELGAPLSRSAIVQQDDGSMYFVWTLHHALYDGWSFPLLSEMAVDAYQGKPMVQRTEFNAFVEQVLREQEDEKTKSYWQSYLAHEDYAVYPPVPTCPKAPNPTERLEHMVPLGRNNGTTVSTMLRAAMGLVLGQYAGFSPGVMFGATVSGRNASVAGLDRVVGPTIATVPVCV